MKKARENNAGRKLEPIRPAPGAESPMIQSKNKPIRNDFYDNTSQRSGRSGRSARSRRSTKSGKKLIRRKKSRKGSRSKSPPPFPQDNFDAVLQQQMDQTEESPSKKKSSKRISKKEAMPMESAASKTPSKRQRSPRNSPRASRRNSPRSTRKSDSVKIEDSRENGQANEQAVINLSDINDLDRLKKYQDQNKNLTLQVNLHVDKDQLAQQMM